MRYGLMRWVLSSRHFLPMEKAQFDEIVEAKEVIFTALAMEEKHDMVLQSYVEYEHELLQVTLSHALFRSSGWREFREVATKINRRLMHLMSVGRLYLDHLKHDGSGLIRASGRDPEVLRNIVSTEHDERLGYRVIEALRNYVQHRGLPIHSLSLGGGWEETEQGRRRKERATLYLDVALLAKDRKFKRAVIDELKAGEERVPLKPLVRGYVTGLMRIQKQVREEFQEVIDTAEGVIQTAMDRYRNEAEDDVIGLAAVSQKGELDTDRREDIFWAPVERRRELARKNRGAGELEKLVVTSD